ncbi:hypothetical protein EV363DRAFT_1295576 [Boletus edulis]|nr:hypothetical protein EV363DRAFT_1295576 [Boletus edulis]
MKCAEEVWKIFEKLVLPHETLAEMQARWDEAVEQLMRQLNMVCTIVTEGIFIPWFIILLDIHLAMSQGQWPSWKLIMDGNVRPRTRRKGLSRGSCKEKEKAQEPSKTHKEDVEEMRGCSTERALSVGHACTQCYESKIQCSLLAKKRARSASHSRSKARPSQAKSSTSRSQDQKASTFSVNSPNVPAKNILPSASPSANDKDRDSSPPPKRTHKSKPSIFGPSQVLEGVVLPSTKRCCPLVIPIVQSTSGTPAPSTPLMPTVADEDRPINATEHNMVLEELQHVRMEQVKTDQCVQTLEDRLREMQQGLERFTRLVFHVWPDLAGEVGTSTLAFPFSASMPSLESTNPMLSSAPHIPPPNQGVPLPSSPTPRVLTDSHMQFPNINRSLTSDRLMVLHPPIPPLQDQPSPLLDKAVYEHGCMPDHPPSQPEAILGSFTGQVPSTMSDVPKNAIAATEGNEEPSRHPEIVRGPDIQSVGQDMQAEAIQFLQQYPNGSEDDSMKGVEPEGV